MIIPGLCPDDLRANLLLGAQIPGVPPTGLFRPVSVVGRRPRESTLVGPGLASEHSYQKKLQEVGQSGTEPMSETRACTYTHMHVHTYALVPSLRHCPMPLNPLPSPNTHSHIHTLTHSPQLTLSTLTHPPTHPPETAG